MKTEQQMCLERADECLRVAELFGLRERGQLLCLAKAWRLMAEEAAVEVPMQQLLH
jgi:hypothetical protein